MFVKTMILALLMLFTFTYGIPTNTRIVNGTLAKEGEIPYIVALKYDGSFTCAGSIVDKRHILSAAHCVDGFDNDKFSIVYGTLRQTDDSNAIRVEKIFIHENYSPGDNYANDVSILRLESDIIFNKITRRTKLPPQGQPTPGGSKGLLAGWGRPSDMEPVEEYLHKAELLVYTDEDCRTLHNGSTNSIHHICAGVPEGGKGQCNGDSGGPLYSNGVQVGIVSWSIKPCARKGYPGVYAKVSTYVDWITEKIQN